MRERTSFAREDARKSYRGMVATDLDGTLLGSNRMPGAKNTRTLEILGEKSVARVIATGRHLRSYNSAIPPDFPVDYVIFSSGAGVYDTRAGRVIRAISMDETETRAAYDSFCGLCFDFMLHLPIPENHRFLYRRFSKDNADFDRRIAMYREFSSELADRFPEPMEACQALAIRPHASSAGDLERTRALLPALTVIRTTSPLDHESLWIEVFPDAVSKGKTVAWLASLLGIPRQDVLAVGNDYNDTDMLEWAGTGCVVDNAKPELKARFPVIRSNDEDGFSEAVESFFRV